MSRERRLMAGAIKARRDLERRSDEGGIRISKRSGGGAEAAAEAHGHHEERIGHADEEWPAWYAEYMWQERTEGELPR
jgi:hypothetical protein